VPRTKRTHRARATFLATLAETCNVSESCRAAGIGRTLAYAWRDDDAEFAAAWEQAEQEAVDSLEKVAWDRAMDNSDRMLEILLKAHRPEKYREKQAVELTGKDGGPIKTDHAVIALTSNMSPEDAAEAYRKLIG
jgi:hypothetical protein